MERAEFAVGSPTTAEEGRAPRPPSNGLQAGIPRRTRSADAEQPDEEGGRRVTKRPREGERRGVSESSAQTVKGRTERNEPRHAGKEWNGGDGGDGSENSFLFIGNEHTPFFHDAIFPSKIKRWAEFHAMLSCHR